MRFPNCASIIIRTATREHFRAMFVLQFCAVLWSVASATSTTPKFVSYNSSDLSYLSNGIQFPVPASLEKAASSRVDDEAPIMEWIRELYNHHHWTSQLARITDTRCMTDMETYLRALRNESSWAVKMFDASGRYTSSFFFGNDFWLGSYSLCDELANVETNRQVPPFPVHFFAVKLRININERFTPVTRQVIMGQCLPDACNSSDIQSILLQEKSPAESLVVVDVRPVPGSYRMLSDLKFHIVGGVTLATAILIVIATIAEIYLHRAHKRTKVQADLETANNNNAITLDASKIVVQTNVQLPRQPRTLTVLLSFSALENGRKILAVEECSKDSVTCIHGLRFFSISWIILVHTYLEVFSISDNKTARTITERSFAYQTISNATFSVDTFFFISGFLLTLTCLRSSTSKAQRRYESPTQIIHESLTKFCMMTIYRLLRLTPAYLFVIGVNEIIARYTHNNSIFSPAMIDHITCDQFWWRNALYINNFYPQHEFCMLWSWYIANDTQFYVFATIILIVAVRGKRCLQVAALTTAGFLVTSWITTFIIAMKYNYVARVEEPFALFDQLYDKPWLRVGPYLIGMATGLLLFKCQVKIQLPLWAKCLGWCLSVLGLTSVVYGMGHEGLVVPTSAFYATFSHTMWGMAIAWIVVACSHNFGGPVNSFLSFHGFVPLSRLAYCTYLIHPVVMLYTSLIMDSHIHLFQLQVMILFLGNAVVSFIVAFLISLFFEAPVVRLLKVMFGP